MMEQKAQREILATNQRMQKKNLLSKHADELAALAEQHRYEFNQLQNNLSMARCSRKLNATQAKQAGKRAHYEDKAIGQQQQQQQLDIEDITSDTEAPSEKKAKQTSDTELLLSFCYAANQGDQNQQNEPANQQAANNQRVNHEAIIRALANNETVRVPFQDLTNKIQAVSHVIDSQNQGTSLSANVSQRQIATIAPRPKFLPITKQMIKSMQMQYRPSDSAHTVSTDEYE